MPRPRCADDIAGADALVAEGNALEDAGDLARAEALYREAVAAAPGHARAHLNLGIVLAAKGDADGAERAYEACWRIDAARTRSATTTTRAWPSCASDFARAETLVAAALRAKPDFPQALVVQSNVLDALGKTEAAIDALRGRAAPAARRRGRLVQPGADAAPAARAHRRCGGRGASARWPREPDNPTALALLSRAAARPGLRRRGAAAAARGRRATTRRPGRHRSFELLLMNFADGIPADELFRRHVEFGADLERAFPARFDRYRERGDPQRRLRVGYVSGDLHLHPVSFFLIPVLEHHDRSQVEVFCYSYGATRRTT